jgi:hypothetical protein
MDSFAGTVLTANRGVYIIAQFAVKTAPAGLISQTGQVVIVSYIPDATDEF